MMLFAVFPPFCMDGKSNIINMHSATSCKATPLFKASMRQRQRGHI